MSIARAASLLVLLFSVAACSASERVDGETKPTPASTQPPVDEPKLPRLEGEWIQPLLDRDGRTVGFVSIPIGAREPRRVVVAAHAAVARAEGMCSAMRASLGAEAFIVCPHPIARQDADASWGSPENLRASIDRAFDAAVHRFGPWMNPEDALYVGHSQGAMIGPLALASKGTTRFRYALLFEGLPRDRDAAKKAILATDIDRILLVSGLAGWKSGHDVFASSFDGTRVVAHHVHADVGHFIDGRVHAVLRSEIPWLLGDEPSWALGASFAQLAK